MATEEKREKVPHENRDPLTDEPGAHPVGVGVGAALGAGVAGAAVGAATAAPAVGAALGAAAGPIGVAVGTVIGGLAGGLVGKQVAERANPTGFNAADEDVYWRAHYRFRPYVTPSTDYEVYHPAYEFGWTWRGLYEGPEYERLSFEEVEPQLRCSWEASDNLSSWGWARPAIRDAWERARRPAELTSTSPNHSSE